MTPIMVAATLGRTDIVTLLLDQPQVDLLAKDRFGMDLFLHASFRGQFETVQLLLDRQGCIPLGVVDNDGMGCLHHVCKEAPRPSWPCPPESVDHAQTLRLLLQTGIDVNPRDAGDATPLHVLACRIASGSTELAHLLLEHGADLTLESASGWTPLHNACDARIGNPLMRDCLLEWARSHHMTGFLDAFVPDKARTFSRRVRFPQQQRPVLTIQDVMAGLVAGQYRNIVVLSGAGMSVAAGIPAFRTKGGLYDQTSAFNEPNLQQHRVNFTPESFRDDPREFYSYIRRIFLNKKPTKTHHFVGLLGRRGLLRRWYTQNIDGLEHEVGVPPELIVEAHGRLLEGRCLTCGTPPFSSKNERLQQAYREQLFHSDAAPVCPDCSQCLRPAVTFFGEPMSERFTQLRPNDLRACDLLLVIGDR